jgi:hypothetical protein
MRKWNWLLIGGIVFSIATWTAVGYALADEAAKPQCPTPGETCKVLYLTPQEEKILMQPSGVLDTAAQARALDLGQFAVYFKTRIAASPQGEVVPLQKADTPAAK